MMQGRLSVIAIAAIVLAIVSGVAEYRRQRRDDLDRIGLMPWPLIQIVSLMVAAICVGLEFGLF
jgi:hypothetical protein